MGTTFSVVDLTRADAPAETETMLQARIGGKVDLDDLSSQLGEIRDALNPVLADQGADHAFRLRSMELDLTVGLEGQVWFVAKGKGEASLKLTWSHAT
jgi:hypothetical protein